MINRTMTNKSPITNKNLPQPKKPLLNEKVGFYYSSSLKISDPKTGEVLVQMRCD